VLVLLVPAAHGNGLASQATGPQMVLVALTCLCFRRKIVRRA
jgi:hypothetical protein